MEKILKKANELGHLLKANEVVIRFQELSKELEEKEDSKAILEELITLSQSFEIKQRQGVAIEVDEKKKLSEIQEKAKEDSLVSEFLATQAYYMNVLNQVNEAIANPQGEPPKDSNIILPGDNDKNIIV